MATASTLAILAQNAVTTWDCQNQSQDPFTFFPLENFPLGDIAWNHNGQVLACCSAVSTDETLHDNVALSIAASGAPVDSFQHNTQWHRPAAATTSLAFGGKSRYLCVGDMSGAVCLWDLKKKLRARQFFHDAQPSLQVSVDPTDTYILSLSSQALHSYKLREGIPAMTWTPQSNYGFTYYTTSALEPQITAVGTDDGSLLLYDITNVQKSVPFSVLSRRHASSITGIAFSRTNDQLLASTSSDGALNFFDKTSGSMIEQLANVQSGISSLTLNSDGVTCAVGTPDGEVIVYDLRQAGNALASMYVEGAVKCLKFSPPPRHKSTAVIPENQAYTQAIDDSMQNSTPLPAAQHNGNGATPQKPRPSGSPQKSVAQHTVSTAGGIGSIQPMPSTMRDSAMNYAGPPIPEQTSSFTPSRADQAAHLSIEQIREVVRDEVENLQDDMEDSIRNLHTDIIRQFHQQSQELSKSLSSQLAMMDQLREENQRLREENAFLKQSMQGGGGKPSRSPANNQMLFGN